MPCFQSVVPACYAAVLSAVRTRLHSRGLEVSRYVYLVENSVSLTSDLWTDPMLRSFVCLTAHWLGDDFVMHSELLSIYNCTERHTSDNLCQFIVGLLKDMELDVSSFS